MRLPKTNMAAEHYVECEIYLEHIFMGTCIFIFGLYFQKYRRWRRSPLQDPLLLQEPEQHPSGLEVQLSLLPVHQSPPPVFPLSTALHTRPAG